jgi:hypothetical protein
MTDAEVLALRAAQVSAIAGSNAGHVGFDQVDPEVIVSLIDDLIAARERNRRLVEDHIVMEEGRLVRELRAMTAARDRALQPMKLPPHKASLHITHNQHKAYYQTVEQYFAELRVDDEDVTPADRAACIATNEVWEIQWYPETPIGSRTVYAPTLERVLERANA